MSIYKDLCKDIKAVRKYDPVIIYHTIFIFRKSKNFKQFKLFLKKKYKILIFTKKQNLLFLKIMMFVRHRKYKNKKRGKISILTINVWFNILISIIYLILASYDRKFCPNLEIKEEFKPPQKTEACINIEFSLPILTGVLS